MILRDRQRGVRYRTLDSRDSYVRNLSRLPTELINIAIEMYLFFFYLIAITSKLISGGDVANFSSDYCTVIKKTAQEIAQSNLNRIENMIRDSCPLKQPTTMIRDLASTRPDLS